jgi:large conductance mechanosensitive channel
MGMINEFKEFAMRGNVIDLAVGVVIGAAFGKIVTSLVDNVIMPPIGLLLGGVDFSDIAWTLRGATVNAAGEEVPAVVVGVGEFLNTIVQFVIIAFAIFLLVKVINRVHRKPEAAPAAPPEEVVLLREIRDSLRK